MRTNKFSIFIVGIVLLFSILACGGSVSTANIGDAWISSDQDGENRTTTFEQDAIIYAQVDLRNAPNDTTIKAAWLTVQVEGTEPDFVINETEIVTGSGVVHFDLSNSNLWPVGSYKVDLYMNGELAQTLTFIVQ